MSRKTNQVWWHMLIILGLGRLRKKDFEFQASLGYMERPYLKQTKQQKGKGDCCTQAEKNMHGFNWITEQRGKIIAKEPVVSAHAGN
jgi:hypothetical protein